MENERKAAVSDTVRADVLRWLAVGWSAYTMTQRCASNDRRRWYAHERCMKAIAKQRNAWMAQNAHPHGRAPARTVQGDVLRGDRP